MKPPTRNFSCLFLLFGAALMVMSTGCAVAAGGATPAGVLLLVALVLSTLGLPALSRAARDVPCNGTLQTACENGVLVDACCPEGAICNFGLGLEVCADGSCAVLPDTCAGATPTPTPDPSACAGDCNHDGSVAVSELILGVAIALERYPVSVCRALDTDADSRGTVAEVMGAVANAMTGCPPECSGYWDQECRNGGIVDVCCPRGAVCNFAPAIVCDDGSCVSSPDTCDDDCDGSWESACSDGVLVRLCCSRGVFCNYSRGLDVCDDGSCVYYPDTCP